MNVTVEVMQWLQVHYLKITEWLATITGFVYIFYTIREDVRLWLYGIISSALFVLVFFKTSIYANSFLYSYYVIIGFYGWYTWAKAEKSGDKESKLTIHRSPRLKLAGYIALSIVSAIPVYFILRKFSDSEAPAVDALLTTGGMVATWMLTQKLIEQWIFWIIIDLIWCGLMFSKGMYPSMLLFIAYTILAFKGYFEWKKELTRSVAK
jgi:nicotinamide mononucleotide transporter